MAHGASSTTAGATSGTGNATLVAAQRSPAVSIEKLIVINEGAGAGFFSIDGGTNWVRLPAAASATAPVAVTVPFATPCNLANGILIKRAGGTDLSGVYAYWT